MINAQINQPVMNKQAMPNQPIMNIAQPNQMINQAQKMPPINQILANPQSGADVNQQQMIDPNGNMNQIMLNQVGVAQIIPQNQQPINQAPNPHMQQAQQMQRVPLQPNRMILTGTQVRPGQIISQNFHVRGMRPTQPNVQMQQQQQPNEYFQQQQQNQQVAAAQQTINPQAMNQQTMNTQAMNQQQQQQMNQPQFQNVQQFQTQQANVPIQNANNMNQMPIQMAPSPSSYAPSPSAMMSSPMSVNMINQAPQRASGPPSVPSNSSPNPTLNTPLMNANSSPQMRQPTNDDQMYRDKLRQLSKYIEPLRKMIIKNEASDNLRQSTETQKIKSLLEVISDPTKRGVQYDLLLRCEAALEKMDFKANLTTTTTRPPVAKPFILGSNVNVCAPLLETIQANYKKPNFNHTLQRTIGPAVAAITNNSYEYSYKRTPDENLSAEEEIPHTVQGEIAKLDAKFYIELDPLQHPQSKTIHMICKIDDVDLPCVPPIAIKVPMDYPSLPPRCYIDKQEYNSSKFLQDIYRIFNNNLEKLPNLYSITTLLDRWEMSIREALGF